MLRSLVAKLALCLALVAAVLAFAPAAQAATCHGMTVPVEQASVSHHDAHPAASLPLLADCRAGDGRGNAHDAAAGHACCQLAVPLAAGILLSPPPQAGRVATWGRAAMAFRTRTIPPPFEPPRT